VGQTLHCVVVLELINSNHLCALPVNEKNVFKRGENLQQQQKNNFPFSSVLCYFIGPPRLCNNRKICDDVKTKSNQNKQK